MALSQSSMAPEASITFVPAMKPPPGVESHPEAPESLAYYANLTVGVCVPLLTICYFARSFVRLIIKHLWIAEDWFASLAWAGTVAFCAILIVTMQNHGGEHMWDLTVHEVQQAAYWFNVATIVYGTMNLIIKLAVLMLYRRVFSPRRWSPFDITIVGLIAVSVGFYGSTTLVKIFECTPRAKIVDQQMPGTCVNVSRLLNASGLFNTISDFFILLLPIHAVTNMKMTRQKKILVVLVFTFGLCAPIFSTVGFVVRLRISGNPDTTWNQPEILIWGAAELATGNLCVCFPEMGILFNRKALAERRRSGPTTSILRGSRTTESSRRYRNLVNDGSATNSTVGKSVGKNNQVVRIALVDRGVSGQDDTPFHAR